LRRWPEPSPISCTVPGSSSRVSTRPSAGVTRKLVPSTATLRAWLLAEVAAEGGA